MDTAMLQLIDQKGNEDFYLEPNDPEKPRANPLVATQKPSHLQQRMFAAG
jgi:hypothetical protein